MTDDFAKCLDLIEKCGKYIASTTSNEAFQCEECEIGFYLDGNSCVEGNFENCKIYDVSSNTCKSCNTGYYRGVDKCELHDPISGCSVYSNEEKNKCVTC